MRQIKIEGLTELAGQLEKLKAIPQGQAVRQALLDGAQLIERHAAANAPIAPTATHYRGKMIAPGGLRRSLQSAPGRSFKTFVQAYAFSLRKFAPHSHLVEFGTKAHTITGRMRFLRGKQAESAATRIGIFARQAVSKYVFARKVSHPGAKETPFFRKAISSQRGAIKRLLESRVKAAFDALGRAA